MYILTPKTNFLGGALVSASHLGKLFPGKLLTWRSKSEFLDVNKIQYTVINSESDYLELADSTLDSIWCNDTCIDGGYFPEYDSDNELLFEFLSKFKSVNLVNHQPINRCIDYLTKMLDYLMSANVKVTIYNYRACWNCEWGNEMKVLFPNIMVTTLPYHYYLDDLPEIDLNSIDDRKLAAMIGRSKSKCKIQYKYDEISKIIPVDQLLPDPTLSNVEFRLKLQDYKYILTGYYFGGEGNVEDDVRYNHLEWSFMDALLSGCIPLTNDLFHEELKRLDIQAPTIGYRFEGIHSIESKLVFSPLNIQSNLLESRSKLIRELQKGNKIMSILINRV